MLESKNGRTEGESGVAGESAAGEGTAGGGGEGGGVGGVGCGGGPALALALARAGPPALTAPPATGSVACKKA